MNLGNKFLRLVTRYCMTIEEPELITDIRDLITPFYVILGNKFSEWLQSSIEIDLGTRM